MKKEILNKLTESALSVKEKAYAPYSDFKVGAALLTKSGKIFCGCNIENSAFSPSNCAERTAFFKAVSEGERQFEAIVICGGDADFCSPCGVCRQVMSEFCDDDFEIILLNNRNDYKIYSLGELMPAKFKI